MTLSCPTTYQIFGNLCHQYGNWWTHKIGGMHQNDFLMAAKMDEITASDSGSS
jgi:hypothetical protein